MTRPARQPGAPPPPRRARGGGRGGGRARARGGEVVRGVGVRPATPHWSGTPPAAGAAAIGVAKGEEGSCSLLLLLHGSRPDASRGRAAVESVGLGSGFFSRPVSGNRRPPVPVYRTGWTGLYRTNPNLNSNFSDEAILTGILAG